MTFPFVHDVVIAGPVEGPKFVPSLACALILTGPVCPLNGTDEWKTPPPQVVGFRIVGELLPICTVTVGLPFEKTEK